MRLTPDPTPERGLIPGRGDSRSFYLTLHHQATSALSLPGMFDPVKNAYPTGPKGKQWRWAYLILERSRIVADKIGPHLGILRPHNLTIPPDLTERIRTHLAEGILYELRLLTSQLRKHTPRVKNLLNSTPTPANPAVVHLLDEREDRVASNEQIVVRIPGQSARPAVPAMTDDGAVDLRTFPDGHKHELLQHLSNLLGTERAHTLRGAISRGDPLSDDAYRSLIGKPPPQITRDGSGLAGRQVGFSYSYSERGRLGAPLMIALLRWRLYSGDGWTAA